MTAREILKARSDLCKVNRNGIATPCKGCPLEKLREQGKSCRDSVLKHIAEAENILKTK